MAQKSVVKECEILSKYYAGKSVSVKVSGDDAYTDGKFINLPDYGKDMTEFMNGFLAHENAHIKYSDFEEFGKIDDPVVRSMANALEDVRIERKMCREFPRVYKSLTATVQKSIEMGGFAYQPRLPAEGVAIGYAINEMRSKLMGQSALEDFAEAYKKNFKKRFPKEFAAISEMLAAYAPKMANTADAVNLAGAIRKIIKTIENQKQKKSEEKPQDARRNGQGNERASNKGDKKSNSQSEKNNSRNTAGNDEKIAEIISKMAQNQDPFGKQIMRKFEKKAQETPGFDGSADFYPGDLDSELQRRMCDPAEWQLGGNFGEIISKCAGGSVRLRELLKNYIQAEDLERDREKGTKGRIMPRKLNRLSVSDPKVFDKRLVLDDFHNTEFHLLCDISGSMARHLDSEQQINFGGLIHRARWIDAAEYAALCFAFALSDIEEIKRSVTYFAGEIIPILGADENVRKNAGRFFQAAHGNTATDSAVEYALAKMSKSAAARKIIIVITDGCPENELELMKALDKAEKSGVEVMALGLGGNFVERYFRNSEVIGIDDLGCIQRDLMRVVKNLLKNKK